MHQLLTLGMVFALIGAPSLLLATKLLNVNPLALAPRLGLWFLALFVIVIATTGSTSWSEQLGLVPVTWTTLLGAAVATIATLSAWPILWYVQKALGGVSVDQTQQYQDIVALSYNYRVFLVATAAIVEEVLYRGYAIGLGQDLLGGQLPAAALSVAIFTLAHFRWGLSHLLSVLWSALTLTLLFTLTGDLMACVLAHAGIDAVGLLLVPAAIARQRQRASSAPADDK
jgi:membrane protease YdiL (CAAX protease family)